MKRITLLLLAAIALYFSPATTNGQIINTVYGDTTGSAGNGIPAKSAKFSPAEMAIDNAGNLYLSDALNFYVRKISASGIISTIAGNGTNPYPATTAPGPATATSIRPGGIAVDPAGDVYVTDGYAAIWKINPAGMMTIFAGDTGASAQGFSGDGGPAVNAQLKNPNYLAADGNNNVYVSDYSNRRVRRIDAAGIITTFAGVDPSTSPGPGDGGPATSADVGDPSGITIDSSGNIFIAEFNVDDYRKGTVRKIDKSGIITTIAEIPGSTAADLEAITADKSGNIFVSDAERFHIYKINPEGIVSAIAGDGNYGNTGDGGYAQYATISDVTGLVFDLKGNLLLSQYDFGNIRSIKYALLANNVQQPGDGIAAFPNPAKGDVTIRIGSSSAAQARVSVTDAAGRQVQTFTMPTNAIQNINPGLPGGVYFITAATDEKTYTCKMVIE